MTLHDYIADDFERFLADWGEAMTYTLAGASTAITGVKFRENTLIEDGPDGRRRAVEARLLISRDASTGIADPSDEATVVIGSDTWHIRDIVERTDAWVLVSIVRAEVVEKTREAHRIRR